MREEEDEVNVVEEIEEGVEEQVHLGKAKEVVEEPHQKEGFLFQIFPLK